mgnify:FL=1
MASFAFDDVLALLPEIAVPALVVTGTNDRITRPDAGLTIRRALSSAESFELSPAGHMSLWEQHETFGNVVGDFAERAFAAHEQRVAAAV